MVGGSLLMELVSPPQGPVEFSQAEFDQDDTFLSRGVSSKVQKNPISKPPKN
jgi:hypothetical protein